ncbi:MAG: decaprenyl-phosphate phosphoribosyltransferase [Chloroflexi bacterium]|nr:MAG: decaprenyl-phosphate phosphoribosyltransferase [Chloroflexota bacterium]
MGTKGRILVLMVAMRPRQWTKNLAIFVGLVFAQQLFTFASFERAGLAFVAFCLASSFIYLLNDLLDLENDRHHPTKRNLFIIASGFVLRILAGAVVVPVSISPWLYLVTILLSLFLALNKRRHELVLLEDRASNHRQILKEYSLPMLDQMITIVTAATIMSYSLYTFQGPTGNHRLMITIPLVLYGMFRYLYLVHMRMEGGSPDEVLLRDRHMLGTVVLCVAIVIFVLYILPQ